MTVHELIEKLKEMPGELEAVAWFDSEDWAGLIPVDPGHIKRKQTQIYRIKQNGQMEKYKEVSEYVDLI